MLQGTFVGGWVALDTTVGGPCLAVAPLLRVPARTRQIYGQIRRFYNSISYVVLPDVGASLRRGKASLGRCIGQCTSTY